MTWLVASIDINRRDIKKWVGQLDQIINPKQTTSMQNGRRTFFFSMSFSKCICLVCQTTIAIPKKGNVERQHCLSSKKWAEKEKGEGTKITINRTTVVFHSGIHKQRPPSKHHYRWVTMERCLKRPSLRQLTPCFGILKTNQKYYHQSKHFSYHDVQLHSAVK